MGMFHYCPETAIDKKTNAEIKLTHFGQLNNFWFNKCGLYEIPGSGSTIVHFDGIDLLKVDNYPKTWENDKYTYTYKNLSGQEAATKSLEDFRKETFKL